MPDWCIVFLFFSCCCAETIFFYFCIPRDLEIISRESHRERRFDLLLLGYIPCRTCASLIKGEGASDARSTCLMLSQPSLAGCRCTLTSLLRRSPKPPSFDQACRLLVTSCAFRIVCKDDKLKQCSDNDVRCPNIVRWPVELPFLRLLELVTKTRHTTLLAPKPDPNPPQHLLP
jgi:hypothetical protein